MPQQDKSDVVPGWIGGFAQSNPAFGYHPDPNLSSLPMLENMANIKLLQRQQAVLWPEFSWETTPGVAKSRCFQMFAPDISRLGYTDTGRVYSIICPQQGVCSPSWGCLNVEVSVTGQRGWADETDRTLAADMTVEGKIWFSPPALEYPHPKMFRAMFANNGLSFPFDKANAIVVTTHKSKDPSQPNFPVRKGETTLFKSPDFARHAAEAWTVGNVEVEIGPIKKTGNDAVDYFNAMVMDAFNLASGNLLLAGNLLTWNVWFDAPALVNIQEWQEHAEKWRKSIDANHGPQSGPVRFFDGTPFSPVESIFEQEIEAIIDYLRKHLGSL
jgi:hypothetical protein